MRSLEIKYPVVGSISLAHPGESLLIADTYFEPIMEGAFTRLAAQPGGEVRMPALLRAWQLGTGPFSVEGGVYGFDPDDGLAPLLQALHDGPDRPTLDTSRLETWDGAAPASIHEALRAMIDILAGAAARGVPIEVEDLP
jgi:hypothetical protein